ncbi:cytochrome b5 [Filobasidium floriforme]|uniref:cytochrome b5 n=1 Tax=Filobasidium floriforme TaxID=5210 RepID=UPI001E8CEB12|nr:cytochrome b5 [Filobasidium floriforme]KAH8089098.1 cytochrome b5 [Filobasidium floriforme]
MSPPSASLAAPKSDPISIATLSQHDGSDPNKPIYLAIKGTVFDVTAKKEMYGPGGSYNIFAGKDGSVGLGKSSLKPEDAIPDYKTLEPAEMKVLDQWYDFFSKRYNVVGKVSQ